MDVDSQINVLIVDDHPENLVALEALLYSNNVNYIKCNSGEEALKYLIKEQCALILLDVQMPGLDGYETAKLIKARSKNKATPIIFITAINQDPEHVINGYAVGAIDYIFKPFDPDMLKSKVESFIDMYVNSQKLMMQTALLNEKTKELQLANEALSRLALHDALTGLPNRTMLYEKMINMIKTASGIKSFALIVFDLNNFKAINDTLGHSYGDTLLKRLGAMIDQSLSPGETIVRLGGDEFAILLPDYGESNAINRAKELLDMIERPVDIDEITLAIGVSLGIVLFPDHGESPDSLLQRADVAMYLAKRSGSGYALYDKQHDLNDPFHLVLMGELRKAVENGELTLYYQPKIRMSTREITGVEALVRWNHPKYGLIPPRDFIPLAEQIGFINPLTYWVLEEAIRQCKAWEEEGIDVKVAVNLSVRSLQDIGFLKLTENLIAKYKLKPEKLQLEITESFLMSDTIRALEVLSNLKSMGVVLSIDDFGTGFSSLSYLKNLPVSKIKIDKSFVMAMMDETDDAMIVRSIIMMAHNLRLEVVAEGVEDMETWETLKSWGCDVAQGYLMSYPKPPGDFICWLKEQKDEGKWSL
jgi:diguanylate cyclase (GGDEF)-like protein